MDGRTDGPTNGQTDWLTDGPADGLTDGPTDGRTGHMPHRWLYHPFNPRRFLSTVVCLSVSAERIDDDQSSPRFAMSDVRRMDGRTGRIARYIAHSSSPFFCLPWCVYLSLPRDRAFAYRLIVKNKR